MSGKKRVARSNQIKFRFGSAAAVLRIDGRTENRPGAAQGIFGAWIGERLSGAGGASPGRGVCYRTAWPERYKGSPGNYTECFHHIGAQGRVVGRRDECCRLVAQNGAVRGPL